MKLMAEVQLSDGTHVRCCCPPEVAIHQGDQCIIDVGHLPEFGHIVSLGEEADDAADKATSARVLRRATLQDQAKARENALMSKMAMSTCLQRADKYSLDIHLVRSRYSFDRSVLMVLFASEDPVDVREMTKEMAGELHCRVEMKQIGVRDEAGIVGGMGVCGRKLCCCTWLRDFQSVNVKMAKSQRLSLNPAAISGCCGRLKCCLRYEYDQYEQYGRGMPRQGAVVDCPTGRGRVISRDVLTQRVKVGLDNERVETYETEEVTEVWQHRERRQEAGQEDPPAERSES